MDEIIKLCRAELRHLKKVEKINGGFKKLDRYTRGFYEGRIFICKQILKKAGKK